MIRIILSIWLPLIEFPDLFPDMSQISHTNSINNFAYQSWQWLPISTHSHPVNTELLCVPIQTFYVGEMYQRI